MPKSLKDQVVFITGASSGFGADAARLFAKEGCMVVLAARRMDRLSALAEEIRLAGGQAFAVPLDVSEQAQIDEAIQTVLDTFGRIDILLNNAGVGRLDWLENLDPATNIDTAMDVNLRGVIQVTRAVLPSMLARRSGKDWYVGIVNGGAARTGTLDLSFLGRGRFSADFFGDVPGEPTRFKIERAVEVSATTARPFRLNAGGGLLVRLRPVSSVGKAEGK